MKINAITILAAGAAGFALVAYERSRSQAAGSASSSIFGTVAAQHDQVQAATPQNIDYLANWQDLSNAWGNDPNLWL